MMGIKLTPAQLEHLKWCADDRPRPTYEGYRPSIKLEQLGFVTRVRGTFGVWRDSITEEGRAFLKERG